MFSKFSRRIALSPPLRTQSLLPAFRWSQRNPARLMSFQHVDINILDGSVDKNSEDFKTNKANMAKLVSGKVSFIIGFVAVVLFQ
jgi:hypothetical protein